jgi:hypothetical protein
MDALPSISPGRCTLLYVQSNSYDLSSDPLYRLCSRHYVSYMGRNISLLSRLSRIISTSHYFPPFYVYGHTVSDRHRHRIIPVSVDPNCMKN